MRARVLVLTVALLAWPGAPATAAGPAGEADLADYIVHWQQLNEALVTFAVDPRLQPRRDRALQRQALWAAAERERKKFADALVWLLRAKPPDSQFLRHWKLLPMYEELLAAMKVIVEGMKTGDTAMEKRGRRWLITTAKAMRETVNDVERRGE